MEKQIIQRIKSISLKEVFLFVIALGVWSLVYQNYQTNKEQVAIFEKPIKVNVSNRSLDVDVNTSNIENKLSEIEDKLNNIDDNVNRIRIWQ